MVAVGGGADETLSDDPADVGRVRVLSQLLRCGTRQGGQEDQLCLSARPVAGREGVCRRKGGGFLVD